MFLYKITRITEGKYGCRSSQKVLDNIGNHVKDDYISETEKEKYGSGLFSSTINGRKEEPVDCDLGNARFPINCNSDIINGKLVYIYDNIKQNKYGGDTCNDIINIIPEAVIMGDNGFYMVDYSKIDVEYKKLN